MTTSSVPTDQAPPWGVAVCRPTLNVWTPASEAAKV